MRRIFIAITVVLILIIGGALMITPDGTAEGTVTETFDGRDPYEGVAGESDASVLPPIGDPALEKVIADAVVVPARYVELSLPSPGIVGDIMVAVGTQIEAGDPIMRLDNALQSVAVARAKVTLQRAQAQLDQLQAGARSQELAAAQATVDAAQAKLDRLTEGARAEDELAAQAALDAAQASLQQLFNGADEEALIQARAELANAEAAVRRAQSAYNAEKWRNDIGARPEALELEQATNSLEAAQARFQNLTKGPDGAKIASAQAEIEKAKAELERVRTPARASDIAAAQAELNEAQARYELLAAGSRPEAIAVAEAEVEAANIALLQEEVALEQLVVKAPFSGEIAALRVKVGEHVNPGDTVAQIGNLNVWQIETDDLTELDITKIRKGNVVSIQFDAIEDVVLSGKVIRIEPIGQEKAGDITYTVIIQPDEQDERLQWNMTATVEIDASEASQN
ncbi:MAG: HlyD family efflux transporter periplasmic adaptor subunit [Chloroflexota bacterium]